MAIYLKMWVYVVFDLNPKNYVVCQLDDFIKQRYDNDQSSYHNDHKLGLFPNNYIYSSIKFTEISLKVGGLYKLSGL